MFDSLFGSKKEEIEIAGKITHIRFIKDSYVQTSGGNRKWSKNYVSNNSTSTIIRTCTPQISYTFTVGKKKNKQTIESSFLHHQLHMDNCDDYYKQQLKKDGITIVYEKNNPKNHYVKGFKTSYASLLSVCSLILSVIIFSALQK